MAHKKLAPINLTEDQRGWLERERGRTNNSFTTIIRNLIETEIKKEKRRGKNQP